MLTRVSLRWLAAIAVLSILLGIGTTNYAQIAKDKGIEAALFTIEGKETVRLKIWATLPEGTKIEVTIGQNKITFTWTAEEVKQGFLDTGHLELAGSEIFVKLLYEKTPNECRIPAREVPKQSYKAFCKLRPAFFSVTGLDLPSSARINTSVSIAATIKNTGEETGTKDVWLEIDGREVERRRDVRLTPNESTTVRFTRSFSSTGRYSVRVATPDDARSSTLSIESRPAYFYVGSVSTSPSSPFPVNTTATFSALIENRGDETGTKPVWLEIDGSRVQETTLTLRPGQSDTVRFSYTFTSSGRYTARIRSPDDSSSTEVTVQARPAYFQVSSCSIPSSANVNQSVTFSARITNTGGSSGSQYIRLLIDGSRVDSKYVSLGPGSSETVYFYRTFNYSGSYSVRIESDDDYCSRSLSVVRPSSPPRITSIYTFGGCLFGVCAMTYAISFEDANGDISYLIHRWTGPSSGEKETYVGDWLSGRTSGTLTVGWINCQPANASWQDTFAFKDRDGNWSNSYSVTTSGYAKCAAFVIISVK